MEWRYVKEFYPRIMVSSTGLIKSLGNGFSTNPNFNKEKILSQRIKKNGYLQVKICFNGLHYHRIVHRLVAEAFIINPLGKKEVNHKNGIKTDNRIENLEWVTSSENQIHAFKTGLQKAKSSSESSSSIKVRQLTKDNELVRTWDSINQVKKELGFNSFGIIGCCKKRKKHKTAYGFKWEYV